MRDVRRRVLTWLLNLTGSVDFVCNYIYFSLSVQQVSKHRYCTTILADLSSCVFIHWFHYFIMSIVEPTWNILHYDKRNAG